MVKAAVSMQTEDKDQSRRIEVAVSYRLGEYRRVLRELVSLEYSATLQNGSPQRFWNGQRAGELVFVFVVPVIFFWKKIRVGACDFSFDSSGLSRSAKGRTARRSWAQVKRVRLMSEAYLIELEEGGAMPVPYRVFDAEARNTFEQILQEQKVDTRT